MKKKPQTKKARSCEADGYPPFGNRYQKSVDPYQGAYPSAKPVQQNVNPPTKAKPKKG
jgi:hypothetical protein